MAAHDDPRPGKEICIRGEVILRFKANPASTPGTGTEDGTVRPWDFTFPTTGAVLSNPVVAYGDLDKGANKASVSATSKKTGKTVPGTWVDPKPYGAQWAYSFKLDINQVWELDDRETGPSYDQTHSVSISVK